MTITDELNFLKNKYEIDITNKKQLEAKRELELEEKEYIRIIDGIISSAKWHASSGESHYVIDFCMRLYSDLIPEYKERLWSRLELYCDSIGLNHKRHEIHSYGYHGSEFRVELIAHWW